MPTDENLGELERDLLNEFGVSPTEESSPETPADDSSLPESNETPEEQGETLADYLADDEPKDSPGENRTLVKEGADYGYNDDGSLWVDSEHINNDIDMVIEELSSAEALKGSKFFSINKANRAKANVIAEAMGVPNGNLLAGHIDYALKLSPKERRSYLEQYIPALSDAEQADNEDYPEPAEERGFDKRELRLELSIAAQEEGLNLKELLSNPKLLHAIKGYQDYQKNGKPLPMKDVVRWAIKDIGVAPNVRTADVPPSIGGGHRAKSVAKSSGFESILEAELRKDSERIKKRMKKG